MAGSKPAALPLGDTPIEDSVNTWRKLFDAGFEPGHITGSKLNLTIKAQWLGCQDSNLGMAGSKPAALPLGDTPNDGGYDGIRTCDPRIMSAML